MRRGPCVRLHLSLPLSPPPLSLSLSLSVCVCACVCVCNAPTFESFELQSLLCGYALRIKIFRSSSYIKVIWSGSRSQEPKSVSVCHIPAPNFALLLPLFFRSGARKREYRMRQRCSYKYKYKYK